MANAIFTRAKQGMIDGEVTLSTDDVRLILHDAADDTIVVGTDDYLNDIAAGGRVATSSALASKTVTSGAFDSADVTLSSVTGDQAEEVIIYIHTGVETTSLLLAYYDTFASGMPVTPNGGDITIAPNASGWFTL